MEKWGNQAFVKEMQDELKRQFAEKKPWRELLYAATDAVKELRDVHDTHVYDVDDVHPPSCELCRITDRLEAAKVRCEGLLDETPKKVPMNWFYRLYEDHRIWFWVLVLGVVLFVIFPPLAIVVDWTAGWHLH